MEQCIQVFLDFARPPTPERREADLTEVLHRAISLVEGRARRQNVTMKVTAPPGPLVVRIDPEQIHQVLVNLLLNAVDALPQGGAIEVEVRLDERKETGNGSGESFGDSWAGKNHGVEVCVRDNGSGISGRIRQRLFEPFVSSKETGLGLGLSICKRLIEDHGGAIRGDNLPQGGAEFAFTLPK
jgi:two-component system sensor histidine kinase HydH